MITYRWIFFCGIIFSSVDSDSDIAPHQEEPLKRLLKRTINHVKSFLGEFENKIKRSRLLVNEIHNQSLISNKILRTNRNDISTTPTTGTWFIRYPDNPFVKRALGTRPQIATQSQLNSKTASSFPDVSHVTSIVRRVASTIKYPKFLMRKDLPWFQFDKESSTAPNILFGKIATGLTRYQKRFTRIDTINRPEEESAKRGLIHTDNKQGINANVLLGGLEAVESSTTIKHPKRLMRQGPARFQAEEEYYLHQGSINEDILSRGTVNDTVSTTETGYYPKRLIRPSPGRFQSEKELYSQISYAKAAVMFEDYTGTKRSVNVTKYPKPIMRQSQIEHNIDAKSKLNRMKKLFRGFEIVKYLAGTKKQADKHSTTKKFKLSTIIKKQGNKEDNISTSNFEQQQHHITLSKFYFRLKQDLLSAPKLDYPDIFSRSVSTRPTAAVVNPASTNKQLIIFTTASPTALTTVIIPELAKDYLNINFRAASSDEDAELKKQELQEKTNSAESKPTVAPTVYTTGMEIKNEKLRKIIAASSYSISDEEKLLKVNLLDQLYHYNKSSTS